MAIDRVSDAVEDLGGSRLDVIDSPIQGMEGNHEYLLRAVFGAT
jgi:23S rRNA (cytidine1920-2'-O)/16S rRNA (cytidine1409-2'-O)-methyltransferase